MVGALFRKLKREVRAAHALLWTPGWVEPDLVSMWFMPQHESDVTRHAALAEECLDDARAHAKRKGRALPPLEYRPVVPGPLGPAPLPRSVATGAWSHWQRELTVTPANLKVAG